MKNSQTTQTQRSDEKWMERGKEQPQADYSRDEFLRDYFESHMPVDAQLVSYVLVDLALKNRAIGERTKALLWPLVGFCFTNANWHKEVEKHEDAEIIHDMQRMLNFWYQQTG